MTQNPNMLDLVYQIFRLDDLLKAAADRITAPSGQTGARWQVLNALAEEPRTVAAIARMKGLARQSIQRLADALAAEGVVEFRSNPQDQRADLVALTRRGRTIHQNVLKERDRWIRDLEGKIKASELDRTSQFLQDLEHILKEEAKP